MTELTQTLKFLCAQYAPLTAHKPEWFKEFVIMNIESLFNMIFPGQQIRVEYDDRLYFNEYEHACNAMIDYVPVNGTTAVFGSAPLSDQYWTHYFVIRPEVVKSTSQSVCINQNEINSNMLLRGWSAIGFALRRMLQRKYGPALTEIPFPSLYAFDVPAHQVVRSRAYCVEVCESSKLGGQRRLSYMGCSTMGALISSLVQQAVLGEIPKEVSLTDLYEGIMTHVPK